MHARVRSLILTGPRPGEPNAKNTKVSGGQAHLGREQEQVFDPPKTEREAQIMNEPSHANGIA